MMRDLQVSDKEKAWSSHYYTFSSQQLVKYELYFKYKTTSRDLPQRPEDYSSSSCRTFPTRRRSTRAGERW